MPHAGAQQRVCCCIMVMPNVENGDTGFLQEFGDLIEEFPQETRCAKTEEEQFCHQKPTSKPKWWKTLAGRRGTKAQRRAIVAMATHVLESVPFGAFVDWENVFSSNKIEIWLEIGFGLGDNLLCNAQMHPEIAMVGADLHSPGVGTVLRRMQQGQQQGRYWDEYSLYSQEKDPYSVKSENDSVTVRMPPRTDESLYSNVRIYPGNGMKLLRSIPSRSLSAVLLTFPDPWPNNLHSKHRMIQNSTAIDLHRVLQNGGRFYLATDHEGYFSWCQSVMENCQHLFTPVVPMPNRFSWLPAISKYEQKGWDEGRKTLLACWQVL